MRKSLTKALVGFGLIAGIVVGTAAPAMAWNNAYYYGENRCLNNKVVRLTTINTGALVHQIADWSGGYTEFSYNAGSASKQFQSRVGINYSPWATIGYDGSMTYQFWGCVS